jgi:hypothetical protein
VQKPAIASDGDIAKTAALLASGVTVLQGRASGAAEVIGQKTASVAKLSHAIFVATRADDATAQVTDQRPRDDNVRRQP